MAFNLVLSCELSKKILDGIDIKLIDVKKSTSARRLPEFLNDNSHFMTLLDENKLCTKTRLGLVHM